MVNNMWILLLATLAATALAVCGSGFTAIAVGLGYCGGDGGQPYAAPASPRGKLCNGDVGGALLGIGVIGGPIAALLGGVVAAARRRWKPFWIGAGLAAVLLLSPFVILGTASPNCSHGSPDTAECDSY